MNFTLQIYYEINRLHRRKPQRTLSKVNNKYDAVAVLQSLVGNSEQTDRTEMTDRQKRHLARRTSTKFEK